MSVNKKSILIILLCIVMTFIGYTLRKGDENNIYESNKVVFKQGYIVGANTMLSFIVQNQGKAVTKDEIEQLINNPPEIKLK